MDSFWWGAIVCLAAIGGFSVFLYRKVFDTDERRSGLWRLIRRTPPPLPSRPVETEILEKTVVVPPPNYGNIRPVVGEETDPVEFNLDIHEFPEPRPPETRYEDFNRRLFLFNPAERTTGEWPETTEDDFPTAISNIKTSEILAEIRKRLRPRYPVIVDGYGWWAAASTQLLYDPDYTNPVVEVYLEIPEEQRPVVVSRNAGQENQLRFMRYGFADFPITDYSLRFYLHAGLRHIIAKLIADREGWMWLSIARMRHAVVREEQAIEAEKKRNDDMNYLEQEIVRKREEGNRWVALWRSRAGMPPIALTVQEDSEAEGQPT